MSEQVNRRALVIGWIAVVISTAISGFWAFWGTLEAFHEGWWADTLGGRLQQTLMYHSPLLMVLALAIISIAKPRIGGAIYFLFGAFFTWFVFKDRWMEMDLAAVLSWLPVTLFVIGVGVLWWFGRPRPRKWAYVIAVGMPLLISLACAVEPVYRISGRSLEANLDAVTLQGNGVELTWAPAGPGWVRDAKHSARWDEAVDRAARLSEDGTELLDEPVNIWRLPTIDEVARCATRHGRNAGGRWDAEAQQTVYDVRPDKEAPLWDPLCETIYWWTASEAGDDAWIYIYHGGVNLRPKTLGLGSQGFRAVKDVK
jgi:hypothetical protein